LHRTLGEQVAPETHLAPDLWAACTDANQLESALLNLCINSRHTMPDGSKLVIETANTQLDDRYTRDHPELEPGDYVALSVSDTGTGMAAFSLRGYSDRSLPPRLSGRGDGARGIDDLWLRAGSPAAMCAGSGRTVMIVEEVRSVRMIAVDALATTLGG
jgi:hypothetical protein